MEPILFVIYLVLAGLLALLSLIQMLRAKSTDRAINFGLILVPLLLRVLLIK